MITQTNLEALDRLAWRGLQRTKAMHLQACRSTSVTCCLTISPAFCLLQAARARPDAYEQRHVENTSLCELTGFFARSQHGRRQWLCFTPRERSRLAAVDSCCPARSFVPKNNMNGSSCLSTPPCFRVRTPNSTKGRQTKTPSVEGSFPRGIFFYGTKPPEPGSRCLPARCILLVANRHFIPRL